MNELDLPHRAAVQVSHTAAQLHLCSFTAHQHLLQKTPCGVISSPLLGVLWFPGGREKRASVTAVISSTAAACQSPVHVTARPELPAECGTRSTLPLTNPEAHWTFQLPGAWRQQDLSSLHHTLGLRRLSSSQRI